MSSIGASGKDTSSFLTKISQNNPPINSSSSNTSATMDDISDHFHQNAAIATWNKYREDRRAIKGLEDNISDNEELILGGDEIELRPNEDPKVDEENEFAAIQNYLPQTSKMSSIFISKMRLKQQSPLAAENLQPLSPQIWCWRVFLSIVMLWCSRKLTKSLAM